MNAQPDADGRNDCQTLGRLLITRSTAKAATLAVANIPTSATYRSLRNMILSPHSLRIAFGAYKHLFEDFLRI